MVSSEKRLPAKCFRDAAVPACLDGERWVGSLAMDEEPWTWPDSLDAVAAAPESHRILFENDAVRVLQTTIAAGETTRMHTHRWPGILYVVSFGHFVRRDGDGAVLVDTREGGALPQAGTAVWSGSLPPHTLENVDTSEIHVIGVELKNG
jgi:hypothetical protein